MHSKVPSVTENTLFFHLINKSDEILNNFSKTKILIRLIEIVNLNLDGAFEFDVAILILLVIYIYIIFILFSGTVLMFLFMYVYGR